MKLIKKLNKRTYGEKKLDMLDVGRKKEEQFILFLEQLKLSARGKKDVLAVILFGSFARGDYSLRHSDIDVMWILDKNERDEQLEEQIRRNVLQISLSKGLNIHALFQYRKVEEEDRSLMLTIGREGKVIFARDCIILSQNILGLREYFLLRLDVTDVDQVRKNKLQRFLYGYTISGKDYNGIVDEEKVFSAGKGAILVYGEMLQKVLLFLEEIGVKVVQKGKFLR